DDLRGAGETRALHRREADRAAADDHNGVGVADMGDIERGADTGHHAAADQAGAVERDVRGNRDRLLLLNDANFAEGAEDHQVLELFAVRAPRLAGTVEL